MGNRADDVLAQEQNQQDMDTEQSMEEIYSSLTVIIDPTLSEEEHLLKEDELILTDHVVQEVTEMGEAQPALVPKEFQE